MSRSQIYSELCVWHEEGAAVCGRAGLSSGPTDRSSTTRHGSLVRQMVSSGSESWFNMYIHIRRIDM